MRSIIKAAVVALAALMATSCELESRNINALTRGELEQYASALYRNHVLLPADMVEFSLELDAYLALTDEQKQDDPRFYRRVHEIGEGVYQFLDDYLTCVVETGGKSVWDEGAEWKFPEYNSRSFVGSNIGMGGSETRWNAWITEEMKLIFNADTMGEAMLMVQVEGAGEKLLMALKSREADAVNTWNLSVQGTDYGRNALRSEYGSGIGNGGIVLKTEPRSGDAGKYSRSKYSDGDFYIDIYDGDTRIDWVTVHLRSDSSNIYETSR